MLEISNALTDWYGDEGEMPDETILNDTLEWINWTYNFLSARKMYHRKAAVKTALLKKMAETLLSQDELAQVDAEAESKLEVE